MSVPENYSAHLETGTVNGHLSIDFPVTVQGRISRELAVIWEVVDQQYVR